MQLRPPPPLLPSIVLKKPKYDGIQRPVDETKPVVIQHSVTQTVVDAGTKDERFNLALRAARRDYEYLDLSPSRTIIEPYIPLPTSPELYLTSHPDQAANDILLAETIRQGKEASLRVFLECLYGACGSIPWYQRMSEDSTPPVRRRSSTSSPTPAPAPPLSVSLSPSAHDPDTNPSSPYPSTSPLNTVENDASSIMAWDPLMSRNNYNLRQTQRYEAVRRQIEENMGNVRKWDIKYLVGPDSGYQTLHSAHHSMSLRACAVQLERVVRSCSRRRRRALEKAFVWLSGYSTFAEAWRNKEECRLMTDRGLVGETPLFADSDDEELEEGVTVNP
jgi:hypothetical protein